MAGHRVEICDETEGGGEYRGLIADAVRGTLENEGIASPCGVDVLLTDDEGIREINRAQRGVDAPTDVLSFPMLELAPGRPPDPVWAERETGRIHLGDMVLSLQRAGEQAEEYGHSAEREVAYLTVHSVLHLLGYDHVGDEKQKAQMRRQEEQILSRLGQQRGD